MTSMNEVKYKIIDSLCYMTMLQGFYVLSNKLEKYYNSSK